MITQVWPQGGGCHIWRRCAHPFAELLKQFTSPFVSQGPSDGSLCQQTKCDVVNEVEDEETHPLFRYIFRTISEFAGVLFHMNSRKAQIYATNS
ncbi:hypothetical protein NPIL_525971 [Nephila pilipes]|uniref:Uncharacterized protein n=1 Tax=Nephila pilipes TaxID=299642 RepID=A0A8X6U553_NEPPI|nr:hypothetical protein NPIL_525971 [Nephila pilipes]